MERLRHRRDFLAAAAGVSVSTAGFVVQERRRGDDGPARVGFTVSRRVGGAVERNRVRRRLQGNRAAFGRDRLCGRKRLCGGGAAGRAGHGVYARLAEDFTGALRASTSARPGASLAPRADNDTRPHALSGEQSTVMNDQKNTIIAVVLSAIVLIGWEYFFALPQKQRQDELARLQTQSQQLQRAPGAPAASGTPGAPGCGSASAGPAGGGHDADRTGESREAALAATPRIAIDTPHASRARFRSRAGASTTCRLPNITRPSIPIRRHRACWRLPAARIRIMRNSAGSELPA